MSLLRRYLPIVFPLIFALFAFLVLAIGNAGYLYALQEHSLFIGNQTFLADMLTSRGGLWAWACCALIQFFYYPWLGAAILVLLWMASYAMLVYAFRLKREYTILALVPEAALLYFFLAFGYWMFFAKQQGLVCLPTLAWIIVCGITAIVSLIVRKVLPSLSQGKQRGISAIIIVALVLLLNPCFRIRSYTLPDSTFYSELRMARAMDEGRWDDIIEEAKSAETPTNIMVCCKNVALMHTGRLLEQFKINNCPVPATFKVALEEDADTIGTHEKTVPIGRVLGSMLYYQYGQINFAYRQAMESGVEYGMHVHNLKMFVRCALINKEEKLARKYLNLLLSTTFHRKWAKEHLQMLADARALYQSQEFLNIEPLMNDEANFLDVDEGQPFGWLMEHYSDMAIWRTPKIAEAVFSMALASKADESLIYHLVKYSNLNISESLPLLYQEALILLCSKPDSPIDLNGYQFDDINIKQRYKMFIDSCNMLKNQGLDGDEIGRRLWPTYGDTWWWYYYFYNHRNLF